MSLDHEVAEIGDLLMDQVFDSLDSLEIGNVGDSGTTDLFGEVEYELLRQTTDDFNLNFLLYDPDCDREFIRFMELNYQDVHQKFLAALQSYETMQEFPPAANKFCEVQVEKQKADDPVPAVAAADVQKTDGGSCFQWSPELHAGFMRAVHQLGGFERATPGNILFLMNVNGLTVEHVKIHFQEYLQGTYFAHEPTKASQFAGSSSFAPPQGGPINPKAANKRPKRKYKTKKNATGMNAQREPQNDDMEVKRAAEAIANSVIPEYRQIGPNLHQDYDMGDVYNPFDFQPGFTP